MATKQELYTEALTAIGDRKFLTSENKEAVRVLDEVYDQVLNECLIEASWNFATKFARLKGDTGLLTYNDTGSVQSGWTYGFNKPPGWVRTHALSADEYFVYPLVDYRDEDRLIKADTTPLYMRYTDTGPVLGAALSNWPALFKRYVVLELATRISFRLTQDENLEITLEKRRDKALRRAKNQDSMDEAGVKFAPASSWTRARWGISGNERGSRKSLTG
jgi:hypothetical protein